jgi:hypothetical protein
LPVLRRQMTVFASGGRRQAWSKVDRHILVPTRYSVVCSLCQSMSAIGPLADMTEDGLDVRFGGQSGHALTTAECRLYPNGHGAMSELSPLSGGKAEVRLTGRQVSF